jgi:hypothetical protein
VRNLQEESRLLRSLRAVSRQLVGAKFQSRTLAGRLGMPNAPLTTLPRSKSANYVFPGKAALKMNGANVTTPPATSWSPKDRNTSLVVVLIIWGLFLGSHPDRHRQFVPRRWRVGLSGT